MSPVFVFPIFMAAHHMRVPTPETLYLFWQIGWAVGGAGLLWISRAAMLRDTDGRVGWSAKPSGVITFFIIYALSFITTGGIAFRTAREIARFLPDQPGLFMAILSVVGPALMALILLMLRRYTPEFSPQRPHRVKPAGDFGFTPYGILRGFSGAMFLVLVSAVIWGLVLSGVKSAGWGDFSDKQDSVIELARAKDLRVIIPFLLGTVIFAPVHEELFYRAGLFAFLRGRFKRLAAYTLCGVVFGLVHGNVAGFVPLAVLGAWFAFVYDTTADLRVPVTLHALFNLSSVVWLLLAPGAATM